MRNLRYELHKVKREIKVHGSVCEIKRKVIDNYGEDTGTLEKVAEVKALFHISKGYITEIKSDTATVRTKGQPMILMNYEDSNLININDVVQINNNIYKVVEKNNIEEFNIISDVSLEVVLDGRI